MIEAIESFFSNVFSNNIVLATILISIIPIIELKGAIPFAMSSAIWKGKQLSLIYAFLWSAIGSSLVVPILVLIYAPVINLLKKTKLFKKIAIKIEGRINTKKENVENKLEVTDKNKKNNKKLIIKVLSVFLFVAIPVPFTGVWTGSCLAVALGINYFFSCLTVILGNIVAGVIVSVFSSLLTPLVYLIIFLSLIIVFLIIFLLKSFKSKKAKEVQKKY